MRLHFAAAVAAVLAASCASNEEPERSSSIVKGTVTFAKNGIAHISECDTRRKLVVGEMTGGPYLRLKRRYTELSEGGTQPVLVEISGTVVKTEDVALIEHPSLLEIKPGRCT